MVQLSTPFSDIPRAKLLFDTPSSIERLGRLTANLACESDFWIKREDCNSGLAFGGNKVRKLEYVLPDAIAQSADTLVTVGGLQSNHMRQTAAAASKYGLNTSLIPKDVVEADDPEYRSLGNIQITELLSAEQFPGASTEEVLAIIESRCRRPYFIPSGASMHPLGGLGFARWAFELEEQEQSMCIFFDTILVALASGSTLGGMVAGFKCAAKIRAKNGPPSDGRRRIIGVQAVTVPKEDLTATVLQIAQTAADKIGLRTDDVTCEDFEVDNRFTAGAYGRLDDATARSIKEFASLEGVLTDPVYTGKAITGLMAMARAGELQLSKNVLFVHTGGQSSLSAYPSLR
ncbi:tryptophan synthase beta subunit-like PLP-dependent enzyme [Zopfia rhizophila CBS 207.26]|uniref:Tryptophan synthase beta subunit-like PLP-dependent enzyme n=1 Tax=Zopfia rhizophila CBS 207.26 TaxID=1314779 RepID=A0A6A6D9B5_9PEZI|nr:tryptophan synthase beta subunit-like PLP-dependent enzyme [Zopfia rhizophila CBS 207.26]